MNDLGDRRSILGQIDDLERQLYDLRRQLAAEIVAEDIPQAPFYVLSCRVGQDAVAFLHEAVEVVVMIAKLTPLPEASPWMLGLLNLRGSMVPVVDVMARLQGRARRCDLGDLIVVCRARGRRVGFVVQEVHGSLSVGVGEVEKPPKDVAFAPYVIGVVRSGEDTALLLSCWSLASSSIDLAEELPA